jgi:hypothetical protein
MRVDGLDALNASVEQLDGRDFPRADAVAQFIGGQLDQGAV